MSRKLIESIEINNFSEYVKKVNKVRPKPYIKGKCRLPIKYSSDEEYEWRKIKYWGKHIESKSITAILLIFFYIIFWFFI